MKAAALREIADRAGVDGGDGAGKLDAMGDVTERFAQRHVGKQARREDRREAAPFDLAGNFERGLPPAGYGHQTDGRQRVAQLRFSNKRQRAEAGLASGHPFQLLQ